jgi:hypothetical protein
MNMHSSQPGERPDLPLPARRLRSSLLLRRLVLRFGFRVWPRIAADLGNSSDSIAEIPQLVERSASRCRG